MGQGPSFRTLGEACSALDPADPQKAETAILEAIRLLEEIGAKPELARTYVSYARLLNAKGETAKAKQHLAKAIGMFRDMGMAWDLERAEQALRELSGSGGLQPPDNGTESVGRNTAIGQNSPELRLEPGLQAFSGAFLCFQLPSQRL